MSKHSKIEIKINQNYPTEFHWNDVLPWMSEVLPGKNFVHQKPCPECGRVSEQLRWIKFTSPKWTWQNMCGRSGPLSICEECGIQVQFLCEFMN